MGVIYVEEEITLVISNPCGSLVPFLCIKGDPAPSAGRLWAGALRGGERPQRGVTADTAIAWPQSEHSGTAM